jgi:hypothetical protein
MQPEVLKRNEEFKRAYTNWKTSDNKADLLKAFKTIYESSFFGQGDARCDIIRQPQYSMLVLHYTNDFDFEDFCYLMDHIQETLLATGYFNYMSDLKVVTLDGGVRQTIERHYLKPATIFETTDISKLDRLFGNVIIETYYEDNEPQLLKLTCNYYNQRDSIKEKGIDKLMEEVLKQ